MNTPPPGETQAFQTALPIPEPESGPFSLPEVRIAVCYVLIASAWIVGSDMLLNRMADDASMTIFLHSFKGLNFVITTGTLLYLVLRRAFGGWRRSEESRIAEMKASGERFRNLSSRIQSLREEERTSISREIHDELGQLLTGIKMKLRLAESRLEQVENRSINPVIDDLVEASGLLDDTIDSVRRISSGLRPPALDHLGLPAALDEEAGQFSRRTGIRCDLEIGGMDAPIDPHVETTAFRIFQESLTNIARHAKASKVSARCEVAGNALTMRVRDNGVGINPSLASNPVTLGLIGMRERASDVGGRLEFRSGSGEGTEVFFEVPLSGRTLQPAALSS